MVLIVNRDARRGDVLPIELQLDIADVRAVLLVEDAQEAAGEEDDIVLRRYGLALGNLALFGIADAFVELEGANLLAVRSVHVQRLGPLFAVPAMRGERRDVEAVFICAGEERIFLCTCILGILEFGKLIFREHGLHVFRAVLGDRAGHDAAV